MDRRQLPKSSGPVHPLPEDPRRQHLRRTLVDRHDIFQFRKTRHQFWTDWAAADRIGHVPSSFVMTRDSSPLPLSAKGIVLRRYADGGYRVLLARNDRGEWELPGGRPEPGESEPQAVARELLEETAQYVEVGQLVSRFDLRIPQAGATVRIAAYGCRLIQRRPLRLSPEHDRLAWLPVIELPDTVPSDYAEAIEDWVLAQDGSG